jgi:hypothetical protein
LFLKSNFNFNNTPGKHRRHRRTIAIEPNRQCLELVPALELLMLLLLLLLLLALALALLLLIRRCRKHNK